VYVHVHRHQVEGLAVKVIQFFRAKRPYVLYHATRVVIAMMVHTYLDRRSVLHAHLGHMHQKQVLYHVTRVQAIHHRQSAPHQSQIVFVMMVIRDHQRRMTHVFPSLMVVGVQHHHVQLHVVVVLRPVYVHVHYHLVEGWTVKVNQPFHVKLQYVLYHATKVVIVLMVHMYQGPQHVLHARLIHMHQKQVPYHALIVQAIPHHQLVQQHPQIVFVMMVILVHLVVLVS
jgi:hypothetical protein